MTILPLGPQVRPNGSTWPEPVRFGQTDRTRHILSSLSRSRDTAVAITIAGEPRPPPAISGHAPRHQLLRLPLLYILT